MISINLLVFFPLFLNYFSRKNMYLMPSKFIMPNNILLENMAANTISTALIFEYTSMHTVVDALALALAYVFSSEARRCSGRIIFPALSLCERCAADSCRVVPPP